jgi:hypothetical protein
MALNLHFFIFIFSFILLLYINVKFGGSMVAIFKESVPCGGILKQRAGVISSPSDTEQYPHGTTCRY